MIEALSTTKQVELIKKKEFAAVAFDPNNETFVVYIVFLVNSDIHLFCRAQIASLIQDETSKAVLAEYINFANIFCLDLGAELQKYTRINDHPIILVKSQ